MGSQFMMHFLDFLSFINCTFFPCCTHQGYNNFLQNCIWESQVRSYLLDCRETNISVVTDHIYCNKVFSGCCVISDFLLT